MTPSTTSDFFSSHDGTASPLPGGRKDQLRLRLKDRICDLRVRFGAGLRAARAAEKGKVFSVLIVGVEVPSRAADIHATIANLRQGSRHDIVVSVAPMLDRGKFMNLDAAIADAPAPLASYDWLVLTDDDISFSSHFLDDLIAIATAADFALCQPAHAFLSHTTYTITRRRYGVLARRTLFVEIGPLTLIRNDLFDTFVPFPASRWCYGIDLLWSVWARRLGRRIGVVDGATVRHLRPVAASYDMDEARAEGERLIVEHEVTDHRATLFATNETVLTA